MNLISTSLSGERTGNYKISMSYELAVWDAYLTLKKRRSEIIKVNRATANRIVFAWDTNQQSIKIKLEDYPPHIPEDLNKDLNQLPKK